MRILTEAEMHQLEAWGRNSDIATMLSFFDGLPRFFHVPRPCLVGSNGVYEILLVGDMKPSRVRHILRALDEPFNPDLRLQKFIGGKKRDKPTRALVPLYEQLRKGFPELCLLNGRGGCGKTIVRAHSVQKALFKEHAKNGHVYQFEPFTGDYDDEQRLWPELIGINDATTFTGFCDSHDTSVFLPIETRAFAATPEQIFLYHYRAFAQDYYARAHKFKVFEHAFLKLAPTLSAREIKPLATDIMLNRQDLSELAVLKADYEAALSEGRWSTVEGHVFLGKTKPDVLTTQFFGPRKDFQGRALQDCKSLNPLDWVSLTVTISGGRALVILSGERECPTLRQLVHSLRELSSAAQTAQLVSYVFCQFENFIILPEWWDSLSKEVQLQFVNAFAGRYFPRKLPQHRDWNLGELV